MKQPIGFPFVRVGAHNMGSMHFRLSFLASLNLLVNTMSDDVLTELKARDQREFILLLSLAINAFFVVTLLVFNALLLLRMPPSELQVTENVNTFECLPYIFLHTRH